MGAIGEGKESAFFRVKVPESISSKFEVLTASLGISIVPTINLSSTSTAVSIVPSQTDSSTAKDSVKLAKKLLENFVNYTLSFSRSFPTSSDTNEPFIPAKIITDWYNGTVRRAQIDPVGFYNNLMKNE